ncbi:MAG: hypothetical protein ACI8RD_003643 [Bacillariaceae sp.]
MRCFYDAFFLREARREANPTHKSKIESDKRRKEKKLKLSSLVENPCDVMVGIREFKS